MELTPMLKRYYEIKASQKGAILFFRLGDFYEMFGEDALTASKILNITLTARGRGTDNEVPMCGVPYHAADNYIVKLIRAGKKVAICEQLSDPSLPGIVKREVTRVVTPGTILDDTLLNNRRNNFIASVFLIGEAAAVATDPTLAGFGGGKKHWGLAISDLTTGDFKVTELNSGETLWDELYRWQPAEVVVTPAFWPAYENIAKTDLSVSLPEVIKKLFSFTVSNFNSWMSAKETLLNHFKVHSLSSFGLDAWPAAIEAAGLLLNYFFDTQKTQVGHIQKISRYLPSDFMMLDEVTVKNLELFLSNQNEEEGSLVSVLDVTTTSMGGRLLRQWILHPLRDLEKLQNRLEAVKELIKNGECRSHFLTKLSAVLDVERLAGRIGCLRANARDLLALKNSLDAVPSVKQKLSELKAANFATLRQELKDLPDVTGLIDKAISAEPPLSLTEGGLIKDGYNDELDDLKKITTQGKEYIKNLEEKEIARTGINSLKVRFNNVFGYYIEVSNANLKSVPPDYIRKQTMVNAERFITPELKEYEQKVLGAEEKIKRLEYLLFCQVRDEVAKRIADIQSTAHALAQLDVYLSFAQTALLNRYCLPVLSNDGVISVVNGRHPVIEKYLSHDYVPNDINLDSEKCRLIMLTGPNMSGKSSYLRQVALIALLAQVGSFVPADSAKISLVDRIFTRVGASDNIAKGQSTFMVEMQEAANILNNATAESLIVFDELGRGTSTYDGVSIAWAIAEYVHDKVKAKTLFATHYHELIEMAQNLSGAQNYCVAVKESADGVLFLHKVLKGGIDRSYGIEVAKLAGLPAEVVWRAKTVLQKLEKTPSSAKGQDTLPFVSAPSKETHPILNKIKALKTDELTPLQALQKIYEFKNELNSQ